MTTGSSPITTESGVPTGKQTEAGGRTVPSLPPESEPDASAQIIGVGCLVLLVSVFLVALLWTAWNNLGPPFVLGLLLVFLAAVLSLFPVYLYWSFQQIKKDRIRGDIWTDLINLGYWSKLKWSTDASEKMARAAGSELKSLAAVKATIAQWWPGKGSPRPGKDEPQLENASVQQAQAGDDAQALALRGFNLRMEEHYGSAAFIGPLALTTILYLLGWFSVLAPDGLAGAVMALTQQGFKGFTDFVAANLSVTLPHSWAPTSSRYRACSGATFDRILSRRPLRRPACGSSAPHSSHFF